MAAKKASSKKTPEKSPSLSSIDEGKTINELIVPRQMDLRSEQDLLGVKKHEDTRNKPIIPGKFDLIIPPGTPRKLILNMAREYDLEIVTRTDIYVPIGISDIQRELIVIRGDAELIEKLKPIVMKRLESFVSDDGAGPNANHAELMKARKAQNATAKNAKKARATA